MSRGKGLAPGKGLGRGKPLEARKPMERKAPTKPARAPRKTGAAPEVRAVAIARDSVGGVPRCQRCGAVGTNVQHREGRGTGGRGKADAERTNGVEWLVVVCGQGNTSGCHQAIDLNRAAAEEDGFVIRRNGPVQDASLVPVRTYRGLRLLTKDGRSIPVDTPTT